MLTRGDGVSYYVGAGKYSSADCLSALSDDAMWQLMRPVTPSKSRASERMQPGDAHEEAVHENRATEQ